MSKGKISVRHAMIMFLIMVYPALLWSIPNIIILEIKQVAWLVPIPGILLFLFLIHQLNYLLVQNPNLSLMECFEKSTHKVIGKLYCMLLLIYQFYTMCMFFRQVTEQILSLVYPNTQSDIFLISFLIIANLITKKFNITIIGRMCEILLIFLSASIILLIFILLPNITIDSITPISYLNIIPIMKSSIIFVNPLAGFFIFVFILSDCIANKKDLMKYGQKIALIILVVEIILLLSSIGTFGYHFLQNTPHSYLTIFKYLQILDFLKGFESLFIIIWVISEFVSLSILIFSFSKLLQYLFNIKYFKNFINILLVLIFVFTKLIGRNNYIILEIWSFMHTIFIFLGFIIPILMVCIYRIRFRKEK